MIVKEFVEEYNKVKNNDRTKESFLKKHIVKEYIGILEKMSCCKALVDSTYHIYSGDIKVFKADSINLYILYNLKLIELYTDIEISISDDSNLLEIYDLLNECGAMMNIISFIPVTEISEFKQFIEMAVADIYDNEYSVVASINGIKQGISVMATSLLSSIDSLTEQYTNNYSEITGDTNE